MDSFFGGYVDIHGFIFPFDSCNCEQKQPYRFCEIVHRGTLHVQWEPELTAAEEHIEIRNRLNALRRMTGQYG